MTRRLTGGLIGLGVAAAALVLFATVVRQAPTLAGPARPDDVLLVLLGWAGLLLAAWLALGSLLALAAVLPGAAGRAAAGIAERITPVAVRKALALALGASVGSLALPPALVSVAGSGPVGRSTGPEILAAPDAASRDTASRDSAAADLAPGFTATDAIPGFVPSLERGPREAGAPLVSAVPRLPDGPGYVPTPPTADGSSKDGVGTGGADGDGRTDPRTTTGPGYVPSPPPAVHDADRPRLLAPTPRPAAAAHDLVTVRRGDSLWSVAARHLGSGATDAEVANEWPRWYAENRDVVGDDPDLLVPGQLLRPPPSASARPSTAVHHPSAPAAGPDTGAPAPQGDQ